MFSFLWGWVCEKDVRSILLSWSTPSRICMWTCMPEVVVSILELVSLPPHYVHRGVCLQLLPLPRQKQSWAQSWPCSLLVCSLSLAMGVSTLVGLSAQARGVSILDLTWKASQKRRQFSIHYLCALTGRKSVPVLFRAKSQFLQPFS